MHTRAHSAPRWVCGKELSIFLGCVQSNRARWIAEKKHKRRAKITRPRPLESCVVVVFWGERANPNGERHSPSVNGSWSSFSHTYQKVLQQEEEWGGQKKSALSNTRIRSSSKKKVTDYNVWPGWRGGGSVLEGKKEDGAGDRWALSLDWWRWRRDHEALAMTMMMHFPPWGSGASLLLYGADTDILEVFFVVVAASI